MSKVIKIIQINIYKGKYLGELINFLKGENPDIILQQEVSCGKLNYTKDKTLNLFEVIKRELGMDGAFNGDVRLEGDENSSFGNAVLTKYPILDQKVVVLAQFRPLTFEEIEHVELIWAQVPRHVLDLVVDVSAQKVHVMSWHGAWTAPPTDTSQTLRQANMAAKYLKSIKEPYILGVDMNNIPQSKTVAIIDKVAINHMMGSGVLQTTHPKIHKIVPRGYLIDYIFTSNHFKLKSISVPEVTVSDHLPVVAEVELISD